MGIRYVVALALTALTINFIGFSEGIGATTGPICPRILFSDAKNVSNSDLNYDELSSLPSGEVRQVTVKLGQGERVFEVQLQTEWERRINLPSSRQRADSYVSEMLNYFYSGQYKELNLRAAGKLKLPEHWQGRFQMAPLSSEHEHFHDMAAPPTMGRQAPPPVARRRVDLIGLGGEKPEDKLTQMVAGSRVYFQPLPKALRDQFTREWSDYYEARYLVASQQEIGTYFDTVTSDLEKRNIAVRLKTRQRAGATADQVVQRMLTIKVNLGEETGFTRRQEIQTPWPKDLPLQDAPSVIRKILEDVLKVELKGQEILPLLEVANSRLAFRLEDTKNGESQKVGFVTVDQFKVTDLLTGASRTGTPITQLEIELFPQVAAALLRDSSALEELKKLIQAVETRLHGQHTIAPKYRQTSP